MHLLYYDEVKFHPPTQPYLCICGVCLNAEDIPLVEDAVNNGSDFAFGSCLIAKETELYGKEISGGSGNFKACELSDRLEILSRLLEITGHEKVKRLYVRVIPENLTHSSTLPEEIASCTWLSRPTPFSRA